MNARVERWAPWIAALLSASAVLVVWRSLAPVPVMHDEWAYWTQAGLYAHAHWTEIAPPVPEFFEQLYVLVSPVWAVKYPPGHALTIAVGFALGVPGLVPVLLTALTGALVYVLARRVANSGVAVLTFVLWLTTFGNLRFRASYFSELTTSACWLVAWWALLEWRETRRRRWMMLLAAAIGWGAITRPATMFVFAIPVGVVVLRDVLQGRRWHALFAGVFTGVAVLVILPLWNARTTGDWRQNALAVYTAQYLPFDVPGYTVNTAPPERALPAEMERVRRFLANIKQQQANDPVLVTAATRTSLLLRDAFGGWRLPFAVTAVVGLFVAGSAGWFALATALLLIVGYLAQAHTADWTIYYLEAMPVFAYLAAVGAAWLWSRSPAVVNAAWRPRLLTAALALGAGLSVVDIAAARRMVERLSEEPRAFRAAVRELPRTPNIVFVRYAERRSMHISLVANDGSLAESPSWIVHDRGDANGRLLRAAPTRAAYLFDEAAWSFTEVRK